MNKVYCLVKVFRQGVYFASPPSRPGRCDFCFDHGHRHAIKMWLSIWLWDITKKRWNCWARLSDTRKPPQLSIVSCIQLNKGGCNSVLSVTLFLTLYPTSFSFPVCHLGGRIYPLIDFVPVGNFYKLLTKLSPAQSNFNSVGWAEETSLSTFKPHPHPLREYW